ncbi:MAG TPA: serine hydrolase domain-containing protein [Caulobacteraceae bacterium]|nr:serine hydrolase domain-containing protein [Caulobacteraceae bacterium]
MRKLRSAPALGAVAVLLLAVGFANEAVDQGRPATGASAAGLNSLDAELAKGVASGRYPGAVFIVANDKAVLHQGAIGEGDVERHTPMRPDTIFRLMSMTKPVTTVAAMILVDEDKLKLDDPVSKYLPEFQGFAPGGPPLTIRHLLTHTGGLGFGSIPSPGAPAPTLAGRVKEIAARPSPAPVGQRWTYSGLDGLDIVARVVEVISGEPYERFLKRRIFDPLGMKDTTYVLSAEQKRRLVGLYAPKAGGFEASSSPLADLGYPSGSANLYTTGPDFARLAQMLAGGGVYKGVRVLSSAAVRQMSSPQLPLGYPGLQPGLSWGLGMRRVADPALLKSSLPLGAYGWSGAFGTHFWVDPKTRLVAVWMINLTTAGGAGSPDALAFENAVVKACRSDRRCRAGGDR